MSSSLLISRAMSAIFLASLALLALQIAMTRVLSATTSHHGSFVAIGLVMLGLATSGATLFMHQQHPERPAGLAEAAAALRWSGAGAIASALVFTASTHVNPAVIPGLSLAIAGVSFFGLFFGAGYGIAYLLSTWPEHTARLYWLDLTGAALGCLIVLPMLSLGSPLLTVAWCGVLLASAGALLTPTRTAGAWLGATLLGAGLISGVPTLTQLGYAKGSPQAGVLWERWSHLARITVTEAIPDYEKGHAILSKRMSAAEADALLQRWRMGWGISRRYQGDYPEIRWLTLDSDAGTQIVQGGGDDYGARLGYLAWDVTTLGYQLGEPPKNVFVIGGGGGRDVLSALHFGADNVHVGELNPNVVHAVSEVFGDFSGRPFQHPKVQLTIGDARSTLSASDDRFDLIQMSMIDTWAASVAGAMVLSENVLYTLEALDIYWEHLADDGVFTVSRWATDETLSETSRTIALLGAALRRNGVERPEDHLIIVRSDGSAYTAVSTCLMKRTPFTDAERVAAARWAAERDFPMIWPADPKTPPPINILGIIQGDPQVANALRMDLSAPTDDRPFFFELRPVVWGWVWALQDRSLKVVGQSTILTGTLLMIYLLVGRILIYSPLRAYNSRLPEAERTNLREHLAPVVYFTMIGLGFLFVEVAILQRYLSFLGHPTYAMSVVLFSLLLSSGAGSALSHRFRGPAKPLAGLVVGVLLTAFVVPPLLRAALGWPLLARGALAVALVVPLGVCMGMMFPLGAKKLNDDGAQRLLPWLWGVNGMAGVIASTVGIMLAMSQGYTAVILVGGACYLIMGAAAMRSWRPAR